MIDPRRAEDPNRFIKAIEEARVRASLAQTELATLAGCRQQNYSALVAGYAKRGGTIRTLDALAGALGLEFVLVTKEEAENVWLAQELARQCKMLENREKSDG
jgi:transcriptional regulator with XRE-family HTH domain